MVKKRVLVVEDHELMVLGVVSRIKELPSVGTIKTANSLASVKKLLKEYKFDLVVLDLMLHEDDYMEGFEIFDLFIANYRETKVLVNTSTTNIAHVRRIVSTNTASIVFKHSDYDVFLEAVNKSLHGEIFVDKWAHERVESVNNDFAVITPTKREKEFLILLAKGYNSNEIAEFLKIKPSTVNEHRKNLVIKFDAKNSTHLAVLAKKLGYI